MTSHELAQILLSKPDRIMIVESTRHRGSYREAMDVQEYRLELVNGLYELDDSGDEIGLLIAP
jgi:hypothetical protein